MSEPPRGIIEHDVRLDMLCCLRDHGPLTVPGLSTRIRKSPIAVAFLLEPLVNHGVVEKTGEQIGQEPLYEVRLDDQPAWVRKAVETRCGEG